MAIKINDCVEDMGPNFENSHSSILKYI